MLTLKVSSTSLSIISSIFSIHHYNFLPSISFHTISTSVLNYHSNLSSITMKSFIASASLIVAATAAPLNGTPITPSSTTTVPTTLVTVATPAATYSDSTSGSTIRIQPEAISRYHISTGQVEYAVSGGHIFRSTRSSDDISTLATFYVSEAYKYNQCSFGFDVDTTVNFDPNPSYFDIFTSQQPAYGSTKTWPQGNLRDQHLGRMKLSAKPGQATFVEGISVSPGVKTFPCPTGYIAGELAPVGDNVDVCFTPSESAGPYIMVHL
jgi:hypothetical protein